MCNRATLLLLVALVQGRPPTVQPTDLYKSLGRLTGQVFMIEDADIGRIPVTGAYFVLQRVDFPHCLIGVRADINGNYVVSLGIGKYRLYCRDVDPDATDLLLPEQPREVTVGSPPNETAFDIQLRLPTRG